jgi:hypothetical protein
MKGAASRRSAAYQPFRRNVEFTPFYYRKVDDGHGNVGKKFEHECEKASNHEETVT